MKKFHLLVINIILCDHSTMISRNSGSVMKMDRIL